MTRHAAFGALALLGASGCASTAGHSRAFDPNRLDPTEGWLVATPVELVAQAGSRDCGAAALAMMAGHWGVPLSLDAAVRALEAAGTKSADTGGSGARLGDLRDLARTMGLKAFAIAGERSTLSHELRAGRPVIVGLHLPGSPGQVRSHYEVVVGAHPADGHFVTVDPASGWRVWDWPSLDDAWRPAGRPALVVVGAGR